MKLIKKIDENEVWEHWKKVESLSSIYDRGDIVAPLITFNMEWFLAEIEKEDLEKMFIISSNDWKRVAPTFRLLEALNSLGNVNEPHVKNILEKRKLYQSNIDALDRKLILVSPSVQGNFTIIEGNKRAVALLSLDKLVGNQIYIGISNEIENYKWARYSK